MLQPAATSVTTSLALTTGTQSGPSENQDIPAGFAALLAGGGKNDAAGSDDETPVSGDAAALVLQATGKPGRTAGGKILPALLPGGEKAKGDADTDALLGIKSDKPGATPDQPAPTPDASLAALALALPMPPAAALATTPTPAPATNASAKSAGRTTGRAATPLAATLIQRAALPGKPASDTQQPQASPQPAAAIVTALATAPEAAAGALASLTLETPTTQPTGTAPGATPSVQLSIDLPTQPQAALAQQDGGKQGQPATTQSALTAIQAGQSATAASRAAQGRPAAKPVAAPAAKPATDPAAKPDADTAVAAAAKPAAPAPQAAMTAGDNRASPDDKPAAHAAAKPETDVAAEPAKPVAAELQPILAMRDAQPAPQVGNAVPVTAPVNANQGGHDFTTLVDRLVEARDAAVPQAIRAAITHSDFGQVSLNFKTDDNRLTVSMASADPGFAPAVQAAAAMHASTSTDSNTNGQRQDSQTQQQQQQQQQSQNGAALSNQPQTQSQAQAQSHGSAARGGEREAAPSFRQTGTGTAASSDEPTAGGRSGIYA